MSSQIFKRLNLRGFQVGKQIREKHRPTTGCHNGFWKTFCNTLPAGRPTGEKLIGNPSGPAEESGRTPGGGSMTMFSTGFCATCERSAVDTMPAWANCGAVAVARALPCQPPAGAFWRE